MAQRREQQTVNFRSGYHSCRARRAYRLSKSKSLRSEKVVVVGVVRSQDSLYETALVKVLQVAGRLITYVRFPWVFLRAVRLPIRAGGSGGMGWVRPPLAGPGRRGRPGPAHVSCPGPQGPRRPAGPQGRRRRARMPFPPTSVCTCQANSARP